MTGEEKERFLRALELPAGSSMDEVERAYWRLKELFTQNSLALFPVGADMSPDEKNRIVAEVEEAYHRLKEYFLSSGGPPEKEPKPAPPEPAAPKNKTAADLGDALSSFTEIGGRELKAIREMLDMPLVEVASETKIYIKHLQNIETENYAALPAMVYLKGYLSMYASHLGLDPAKVTADFLKRYSEHGAKKK